MFASKIVSGSRFSTYTFAARARTWCPSVLSRAQATLVAATKRRRQIVVIGRSRFIIHRQTFHRCAHNALQKDFMLCPSCPLEETEDMAELSTSSSRQRCRFFAASDCCAVAAADTGSENCGGSDGGASRSCRASDLVEMLALTWFGASLSPHMAC